MGEHVLLSKMDSVVKVGALTPTLFVEESEEVENVSAQESRE